MPLVASALPLTLWTLIGPGKGLDAVSSIRVPPETLVAAVAPVVAMLVLPTTVVGPELTMIVVVRVGGLGPTIVWDLARDGSSTAETKVAPHSAELP